MENPIQPQLPSHFGNDRKVKHRLKYEALAQRIGVAKLRAILPATPERIKAALAGGDQHLNTIPLAAWDKAAGLLPFTKDYRMHYREPWTVANAQNLSLAERVCTLKHVATYHLEVNP